MDEITISSVQALTSYGALGAVCVWLMYLHTTLFKKVNDTLGEIAAVLEIMRKDREED